MIANHHDTARAELTVATETCSACTPDLFCREHAARSAELVAARFGQQAPICSQTFEQGSRVSVGMPFRQDGRQVPDGYEGIWYVALQRGSDLLLSKSRTVAVADEQGEVWMNIGRCART